MIHGEDVVLPLELDVWKYFANADNIDKEDLISESALVDISGYSLSVDESDQEGLVIPIR